MSTVKTKIEKDIVVSFLKENFDDSVENIEFLEGGEMSQAFSFNSKKGSCVIRINTNSDSFEKDIYAVENFTSKDLPVPEIIEIGKFDDKHYFAISKKAEGKTVNNFSEIEYQAIVPDLLSVLDSIHATDIRDKSGYGKLDIRGIGKFDSWKDFVLSVGKYAYRDNLFETSFLEKEVWEKIFNEIKRLSEYCTEDRSLVHGDYGSDNVVADNNKITGVLDWEESMYGDFLYDIAWLSFWSRKNDPQKKVENFYRAKKIPNFEERLLCYKLRIGLGSLSFYAFSGQEDKYKSTKERTLSLLSTEGTPPY